MALRPRPAISGEGRGVLRHSESRVAYADGRVFMNTLDGLTAAVDAEIEGAVATPRRQAHPFLYEAAVLDDPIHLVQHVSLIHGRYGRLGYGAALLYIFATAMHSGGLGALLTFSNRVWYPLYQQRAGGAEALADQQLAGLIMWVPVGSHDGSVRNVKVKDA